MAVVLVACSRAAQSMWAVASEGRVVALEMERLLALGADLADDATMTRRAARMVACLDRLAAEAAVDTYARPSAAAADDDGGGDDAFDDRLSTTIWGLLAAIVSFIFKYEK